MTTLVGLDVGTTGVKAIAITPEGEVVSSAEETYPLSTPQPGWSEQNPDDWLRAAERALARLGVDEPRIGFSGQMHGLVCLDDHDRVLRPAILWNDQRTAAECAEIEERVGLERLISLTGNRALPGFTAPKLLWLRRHEPDVYRRIRRIVLPKDYVRFRLNGEWAIDVADASGTLLFDVAHRRWSDDVLAALEVPHDWLPPVHESTEIAGAGDQQAAALGVGVIEPGIVSVVLGTSGVVLASLPAFAHDREARVHAFCHARPGHVGSDGRDAQRGRIAAVVSRRSRAGCVLRGADGRGRALGSGGRGLDIPPLPPGRADSPRGSGCAGLVHRALPSPRSGRAGPRGARRGRVRSARLARASAGARCSTPQGRVSGGGARSRLWLEIVASVLGLPLELTVVEEGSAYGAALLAGVVAGSFVDADDAVAACVRARERIEPNARWASAYEEGYARFRALYPALRGVEER